MSTANRIFQSCRKLKFYYCEILENKIVNNSRIEQRAEIGFNRITLVLLKVIENCEKVKINKQIKIYLQKKI